MMMVKEKKNKKRKRSEMLTAGTPVKDRATAAHILVRHCCWLVA